MVEEKRDEVAPEAQKGSVVQDPYRRLFELSADLLGIASMEGYFLELSPSWEGRLGYTREELRAQPFLSYVHPDDQAATLGEVSRMAQGAVVFTFKNRYRAKDGTYRWIDWTSVPKDGLIYFVARDVTDQQQLEEELRASRSEVEARYLELEREMGERRQAEAALQAQNEAVRALSTPILQVAEGVLLLPVIGQIDAGRAAMMMVKLLESIVQSAARVTILDLTGVADIDTNTTSHVFSLVHAARLLGSDCLVSGIRPAIASTMVELGLDTSSLRTFGTLAAALSHALGLRAPRQR
ncbi:PAS domain S-box protein [Polyangium jinanense]|uniref:PAS domain S-box protein n=1 Tax=Polyangium jinanense TaxID=2829994 RepID=A0A9X3XCV1_9BACT|nr:PAS domain S-box protein [Polyangium jinanense]MDC3957190.1 PAS domain S-box protein [Polyangium jinanense]MDC3986653.1 PAS domain S-box protein [Polyangium jinanense]